MRSTPAVKAMRSTGGTNRARARHSRIVAGQPVRIEIVCNTHSSDLLQDPGMTSKTELHVISSADLQRFASGLFAAAGVAQAMAEEWAKSLVWANLRGVDSHGVLRIPGYIDRLKSKAINPAPKMRVEKRAGAIAVLEADRAPGAVAMTMAMAEEPWPTTPITFN